MEKISKYLEQIAGTYREEDNDIIEDDEPLATLTTFQIGCPYYRDCKDYNPKTMICNLADKEKDCYIKI